MTKSKSQPLIHIKPTTAGQRVHTEFDIICELPTPSRIIQSHPHLKKGLPVRKTRYLKLEHKYAFERSAFTALFDALAVVTYGNVSKMATLLSVSQPTILKWKRGYIPKQWYWPYVIYLVLRSNYEHWRDSIQSNHRRTKSWNKSLRRVAVTLGIERPLSNDEVEQSWPILSKSFTDGLSYFKRGHSGALKEDARGDSDIQRLMIVHCVRHYSFEVNAFANEHGLPPPRVKRAAKKFKMVKSTSGFGENKQTAFTLPPEWGLDFEGAQFDEEEEPEVDIGRPQFRRLTKKEVRELIRKAKEENRA